MDHDCVDHQFSWKSSIFKNWWGGYSTRRPQRGTQIRSVVKCNNSAKREWDENASVRTYQRAAPNPGQKIHNFLGIKYSSTWELWVRSAHGTTPICCEPSLHTVLKYLLRPLRVTHLHGLWGRLIAICKWCEVMAIVACPYDRESTTNSCRKDASF